MVSAAPGMPFQHDRFHARAKVFDISPKFIFYDLEGNKIAFLKQKLFKLKEDIRLYTDDSMARELLQIKARQVIDWSAAYDVVDSLAQQKVGALRRRGWKSVVKDEWIILDAADQEIGRIKEDSALLAAIRRFVTDLVPQTFVFYLGQERIGEARQRFNPFVRKMDIEITDDPGRRLDRRLVAAAVVLLLAIEGRQG